MKRDDILNSYWLSYLKYWKQEVDDVTHPPTENDFWAWYAKEKLGDNNASRVNVENMLT